MSEGLAEHQSNAPAVINDLQLTRRVRPVLEAALGADHVVDVEPTMAGEDFAYFANQTPGFHFRLGIENPEKGSGALHTPAFRADDGAIEVGVKAMVGMVPGELGR